MKEHRCTKNWSDQNGSSGMEAAIIVEGFKQSEQMYGIRYQKLIADGDSSVYKKILDARPYKNLVVQKVECRNHLLRNFCNKLKEISVQKQAGQLVHRKLLSINILRMRKGIIKAIEYRKKENSVEGLRNDILNVANHVFGDHKNCSNYFCKKDDEINYMEKIESSDRVFFENLMRPIRYIARHSSSLILNVDSNIVESFNAIIAKLIAGKRINYALKGSYAGRCAIAAVTKNTKRPLYSLHKSILKNSPIGKLPSVKMEITRRNNQIRQNNRLLVNKRFKKKLFVTNCSNASYGDNALKPDMSENEFNIEKNELLDSLKKMAIQREVIERETIKQSSCNNWYEIRRKLLTASNFGNIINRRPDTGCENLIKNLLYTTDVDTTAMEYGRNHEKEAKICLEKLLNIEIMDCGLFINEFKYFLVATPDGLIKNDGLVEIKCPQSAADMTPEEGIIKKKINCWKTSKDGSILELKKNHKWYFQIQGQLNICEKDYCIFAVWTKKGIKYEIVKRDVDFWTTSMLPKLEQFYYNCYLPELVDPRYTRNMPIRNPDYIIKAQEEKKNKTVQKKNK